MGKEVLSRLKTKIAYDAADPKGLIVVISPGVNPVNDAQVEVLKNDKHFDDHREHGHVVLRETEAPKPAPAPLAAEAPKPAKGGTQQKPGATSQAAVNKDQAGPDAQMQMVVDTYKSMEPAQRDAFYATLSPDQKTAIDAANKAG